MSSKRFVFNNSCRCCGKDFGLFIKVTKKLIIKQFGFITFYFVLSHREKLDLYNYWFKRLYYCELSEVKIDNLIIKRYKNHSSCELNNNTSLSGVVYGKFRK